MKNKAPNAKWCFLYREVLAAKNLSGELCVTLSLVVKCVNFKSKAIKSAFLSSLRDEMDVDHRELLLHTKVR